jgi:hypothetical protein
LSGFDRLVRFFAAVGALLLLISTGCRSGNPPGERTPNQSAGNPSTSEGPSAEPNEPIVRLDPPKLDEPKADAPRGTLLRLHLKPGESFVRVFRGQSEISLDGADPVVQKFNMRVTATVEGQDGEVYTIKMVSTPLTVEEGATSERSGLFTEKPTFLDVDNRGRLLTPPDAVVAAVQTIGFLPFPEKRILPGASWSMTGEREWPLLGKVKATETWTFRGQEKLNGSPAYKIEQTTKSDIEGLRASATYYLNPETGRLIAGTVRQEGRIELPSSNGKSQLARVKLILEITSENVSEDGNSEKR